ncbi:unnamed protein product [Eruca vesicaria subsp. sativa]|uniref:DNA/RNA-binding protein Alba-like domain-containing protein n=1 Tax=Eruca vesicaria subsp. sativa TaxID=29727 RepID=A0ABC8M5U5_ERUVS|nr:unnamed protein product [Eruca vesicaria subsp. sativa]
MSLLQEKGSDEVIFKAMGKAINKSVTIAELIKRRIPGIHQHTSIGSIDITDTWEPKEEGLLPIETTRHVSVITITLSKKELNTSVVGYQCPIPVELVKPFAEIDYEGRDGSPRGRGRRDRGRGRGRGGRGDGYVNVEYDDGGGMEPERVSGRGGRGGRGRGGRGGRGRGGYGGHYEAQQDGGDYGHNGPPQQYHGYDDGGMEPERPSGRGRGAGEEEDEVAVEEEVSMVLHLIMKPNKTEETMATMVVLHRIMSTMMEVWSLSGHLGEEEGAGEEVHVVVVEEEVSVVLHLTMKLIMMRETTDTMHLNRIMDTMLLLRAVEDVEVEGEVVEEEEAVVDSTDQMDHRFRQLLK